MLQINPFDAAKYAAETLANHLGNRAIPSKLKPGDAGYEQFVPIATGNKLNKSILSFKDLRREHLDAMTQNLIDQLNKLNAKFFCFAPILFAAGEHLRCGIHKHNNVEVLAMLGEFPAEKTHILSLLTSVLPSGHA